MGFLDNAKDSLLTISKKIKNKTEDYSKIAKLSLEIKKNENEIEKIHIQTGKLIIEKIDDGADSIDLNNSVIVELNDNIKECEKKINTHREQIEELKKSNESKEKVIE